MWSCSGILVCALYRTTNFKICFTGFSVCSHLQIWGMAYTMASLKKMWWPWGCQEDRNVSQNNDFFSYQNQLILAFLFTGDIKSALLIRHLVHNAGCSAEMTFNLIVNLRGDFSKCIDNFIITLKYHTTRCKNCTDYLELQMKKAIRLC